MNNTMISTIDKSKALPDVKEASGWYEYEPSYDGVITHINTAGARLLDLLHLTMLSEKD